MTRILFAIIILVGAFSPCRASEGTLYGAIYACYAHPIIDGLEKMCIGSPMEVRAKEALGSWRTRFGVKAKESAESCRREDPSAYESAQSMMVEKYLNSISTTAQRTGATPCEAVVRYYEGPLVFDADVWK